MTRPHPYGPDEDFARRKYTRAVRGLSNVAGTVQQGRADDGIVDAGVKNGFEAAALGWFLGEPVETLRGHLVAALPFVRYALSRNDGDQPAPMSVGLWVSLAAVTGDRELAEHAGARLTPGGPLGQPAEAAPRMLAGLAYGAVDAARARADELAAVLADPATPPDTVHAFGGLAEIAITGLAGDVAGQHAALRARGEVTSRFYRRSAESRRQWMNLFDHYAAATALLSALGGGPDWPDDVPSLPVPLLPTTRRS